MIVKTKIVPIGNSKGVRIPKSLLTESRLGVDVDLRLRRGEIRILSARKQQPAIPDTALASEPALSKDWMRPEEDTAWANL